MNKTYLFKALLFFSILCLWNHSAIAADDRKPEALADQWALLGEAINEAGWDIWGSSPIVTGDGKVHLFVARWPGKYPFDPAWRVHSQIARYTADGPEGPFVFQEVVLKGDGKGWDAQGYSNPNIQKVGNRFVLTCIANDGKSPHGPNQRIGMWVAGNIDGPWTPANGDPESPMLAPPADAAIWCYQSGCGVNNPALLAMPDGKLHLYFKAKRGDKGHVCMGLAIAEKLEGPYVIQPTPVTANDRTIEDGYAFRWRGHVCIMTTDNHGMLERGGGLLWASKDGTQFDAPMPGFHHFGNTYFPNGVPTTAKAHYTRNVKCERPQILMINNEPAYLYAPCGVAVDGSDGTNCYLFKRKTPVPTGTPGKAGVLPAESRASLEDHQPRTHIFADPDWFQWGGSVIEGDDGKYHMFYSRWRRDNPRGMRGWLYVCQIARATADRPEGPYTHQEIILKGFGQPQAERWDAINSHNPCITRMRDPETGKQRYYLYYIGTRDDDEFTRDGKTNDWWDHIINQRVGVAVADSLEGPWTRHPEPVISPPTGPLRHYLVNPGVCQLPDGRFLMVLKGRSDGANHGQMIQGWALADRPEGPFTAQPNLLFPKEILAEDPCVWVEGKWVFAAVKDWNGQLSGTPGISYVRGRFEREKLVWETPADNNISPRILQWSDGQSTQIHSLERPFVLRNAEGVPTHLFCACSVENPFGGNHSAGPTAHLPFNVCLPLNTEKTD